MKKCLEYKNDNLKIQGLSRLNEDLCYKKLNTHTSVKPGKYLTKNFKDCKCMAPNVQNISLQYPALLYRDGYGWTSNNGCNIDTDSNLRNSKNLTNMKCIHQLFERPYKTVPYMGRGEGNICVENKLKPSDSTFDARPCNKLSGIYIDRFVPQISCIKNTIQKPIHLIPEDNDINWIRGGQPSRQIIRNNEYLKKCGFKYNGKYWINN